MMFIVACEVYLLFPKWTGLQDRAVCTRFGTPMASPGLVSVSNGLKLHLLRHVDAYMFQSVLYIRRVCVSSFFISGILKFCKWWVRIGQHGIALHGILYFRLMPCDDTIQNCQPFSALFFFRLWPPDDATFEACLDDRQSISTLPKKQILCGSKHPNYSPQHPKCSRIHGLLFSCMTYTRHLPKESVEIRVTLAADFVMFSFPTTNVWLVNLPPSLTYQGLISHWFSLSKFSKALLRPHFWVGCVRDKRRFIFHHFPKLSFC